MDQREHPTGGRDPELITRQLLSRAATTADPALRLPLLARGLKELPDEDVVAVLEVLQRLAARGDSRARGTLIELGRVVSSAELLPPADLDRWRALAEGLGSPAASLLSATGPRMVTYAPHHVDVNEVVDAPLGRRKTWARTTDRALLDRMLYDKHPGVVAILLENPRVLERDVVRMAASTPTTEAALRTIAAHPRWVQRYRVRSALSLNPWTPASVARRLLPTLLVAELRAVASHLKVHDDVRGDARALLAARGVRTWAAGEDQRASFQITRIGEDPAEAEEGALAQALLEAMCLPGEPPPSPVEEEPDAEIEALAADFLAHLGPLELVPVAGGDPDDDEGPGEPVAPAPWRTPPAPRTPRPAPPSPPAEISPPTEAQADLDTDANAVAAAFLANLKIVLVPVDEAD